MVHKLKAVFALNGALMMVCCTAFALNSSAVMMISCTAFALMIVMMARSERCSLMMVCCTAFALNGAAAVMMMV